MSLWLMRGCVAAGAAACSLGALLVARLPDPDGAREFYALVHAGAWRADLAAVMALSLPAFLGVLWWQARRTRRAQEMAARADSAKAEFLSNVSHELRTPLNGISGMAAILARTDLQADQREMVAAIDRSSATLSAMIDDLLDFSRIEAGSLALERVSFDAREMVEEVAGAFAPRARAQGLTLQAVIAPRAPQMVEGDPPRVRQVLSSLVDNALKFTRRGGVRVELAAAGDPLEARAALFRVADTGVGMGRETMGRLFLPFSQGDSRSAREHGGMGLGLALARRLVVLMGGSLGAESEPGRGSTFWFLLPTGKAACALSAVPEPTPEGFRILIIEDNPVNQIVASRAVRGLGYAVEVVSGGQAALGALSAGRFDLVLMDCQMPGMDGYQTAAEIRRREGRAPRLPIIAMTANAIPGDVERCLAAGMDDYLGKPVRLAELSSTLDRWLGARGERRARAGD
ncbi:MAG: response regulator [Acidobacteriia bacterium]|nr:response regulator [Terriglobia bacterium]